ncbi:hypothetical protein B566_EDAN005194 [Ephemera danica]|nr:hypothetical protein B566_EDAN005194 [Ephemera danica]
MNSLRKTFGSKEQSKQSSQHEQGEKQCCKQNSGNIQKIQLIPREFYCRRLQMRRTLVTQHIFYPKHGTFQWSLWLIADSFLQLLCFFRVPTYTNQNTFEQ